MPGAGNTTVTSLLPLLSESYLWTDKVVTIKGYECPP